MKRPLVVVLGLAVAGLVMLSWTQTWFSLHLDAAAAVVTKVDADGSKAVPQYTALAIASLALFLALTIAGRVVRIVLASIEVLLGIGIVATGVTALVDPVAAARGAIGDVAGVSDIEGVRRIVTSVDVTPWPFVGIVGGVLAVLLGIAVLFVQRSWPGPSRKYGAATAGAAASARAAAPVERDAVVDWDDLSAGVDPTDPDVAAESVPDDPDGAAEPVPDHPDVAAEHVPGDPVGLDMRRTTRGGDNEEHREQH